MKTNLSFTRKSRVLFVVLTILIVGSCKKDQRASDHMEAENVQKITSWYHSKLIISEENVFSKLQPKWDYVYSREDKDFIVYEIDLDNPDKLVILNEPALQTANDLEFAKQQVKMLVFESKKTGKILYASYMSIESKSSLTNTEIHYRNVGDFTGKVLFYHFNGKLGNGWEYGRGKLEKQIKAATRLQYDAYTAQPRKDAKTESTYQCTSAIVDKYRYGCTTVMNYMNCGWVFAGSDYITTCKWVDENPSTEDEDTGEPGDGEGGGYIPNLYFDCHDVLDGEAYVDEECGSCVGGTTGITCGTIKKNLDSFPCAKALVNQMSTLNSDVANLIKNAFGKTDRVNLTIQPDYALVGDTLQDGHTYGSGNSFNYAGKKYFDITVGINPDVLKNATKEYILVVIYHEALHAYLDFKKRTLTPTEFSNQFEGLSVNGGRLLGVQDPSHWPMGYANFVNGLRDVILAYNPNFDATRAYAMALYGIGDLTPAQRLINQQEKNTLVTGYTGHKCP